MFTLDGLAGNDTWTVSRRQFSSAWRARACEETASAEAGGAGSKCTQRRTETNHSYKHAALRKVNMYYLPVIKYASLLALACRLHCCPAVSSYTSKTCLLAAVQLVASFFVRSPRKTCTMYLPETCRGDYARGYRASFLRFGA